jgi:hypothetical protein
LIRTSVTVDYESAAPAVFLLLVVESSNQHAI